MNRRQKMFSYTIEKVHEQHVVISDNHGNQYLSVVQGFLPALAIDLGHSWMVISKGLQNVADAAP